MEEIKKEGHPEGCKCFMCQRGHMCKGGHCGNHMIVRIILGLLILAFVFFAGFWFGNMASIFRHGGYGDTYGYGRMMQNRSGIGFDEGRCAGADRLDSTVAPAPAQGSGSNTTTTPAR